jgi:predicted transcriptional regulator
MHSTANFQQPGPAATTGDWQRVTPVGRLEPRDITTAIYDAAVSFGLITIGGLGACWYYELAWWFAPAAGFTVGLWRYFGGLALAKGLLKIVETITGTENTGDDQADPKPQPQDPPVALEVIHKSEAGIFQRMFRFTLPETVTEKEFQWWATGVINRPDLTQARWVSKSKFSREAYVDLLGTLEDAGIIERAGKAKNASYSLTPAGKRALRQYLIVTHSHSLTRTSDNNDPDPQDYNQEGR